MCRENGSSDGTVSEIDSMASVNSKQSSENQNEQMKNTNKWWTMDHIVSKLYYNITLYT